MNINHITLLALAFASSLAIAADAAHDDHGTGHDAHAAPAKAEPLMSPPLNATFIHRQTLANQVRFTTVELADLDARIAQAADDVADAAPPDAAPGG